VIPEFNDDGLLPPGIHSATMREFHERFAVFDRSDRRLQLCRKIESLWREAKGTPIVRKLLIAGSIVTSKPEPNDFDALIVLDPSIVGTSLRPFEYNLVSRSMARRVFGGDVVPVLDQSVAHGEYLEFFQKTRDRKRMGIVEITDD
jgi:hypothetical protein